MKRILILALLCCVILLPGSAAAEAAQATPAEAEAAENEPVTLFDARYYFEHRLLRQLFYAAPEKTMESLCDGGLYETWNTYAADTGFDVTFGYEQFSAREMPQDGGIRILVLTMPRPEDTLLCYRIYLCYDTKTGDAGYYTAEYDKFEGLYDEGCLICGWTPDGTHRYYAEGIILPEDDGPAYENALAEEAAAVLELMRER